MFYTIDSFTRRPAPPPRLWRPEDGPVITLRKGVDYREVRQ